MARSRNIKPGFYKNEDLAECSVWARYIFPGLWMLADREGRLEDRPKRIKGELLPFDGQDVEPLLVELERRGFLVRYRNSDGSFIQISKFSTHQAPHYSEKQSVIKGPEPQEKQPHDGASTPENSGIQSGIKSGSQPPDSLIPDSLILRLTDSPNPDFPKPGKVKTRSVAHSAPNPLNVETWKAYKAAYIERYGVEPVRPKIVNAQIAGFVEKLGAEAPAVARHYVQSNNGFYVRCKHDTGPMLKDATGLRTEWATGNSVTQTQAMQTDRTAANGQVWGKLIREAEERERNDAAISQSA